MTNTHRLRLPATLLLLAVFALVFGGCGDKSAPKASAAGPRALPLPVGVSDVVRESLSKTPTLDVAAAKGAVFTTAEQWEAWAKEGDVPTAKAARALAKALSVTVQEDKIGGVSVHRVAPPEIGEKHGSHLFVYIHGGARWRLGAQWWRRWHA